MYSHHTLGLELSLSNLARRKLSQKAKSPSICNLSMKLVIKQSSLIMAGLVDTTFGR